MNAHLPDLQAVSSRMLVNELARRYWVDRKRWLARAIWVVLLIAYGALLFATFLPPQYSRTGSKWVLLSLMTFMTRTFAFHAGLGFLVAAVIALFLRRWKLLLAMLPFLIWTIGPELWYAMPKSPPPVAGETLRVMSVNLFAGHRDHRDAAAAVRDADPDIVMLQEYTAECHEAFTAALGDRYQEVRMVRRPDSFGIALYAKRDAVGEIEILAPLTSTSLPMMRGVFNIDGRPVAFYNVHLHPPSGIHGMRLMRLKFDALLDMLAAEKLPAVVMGDFNATCNSPYYESMTERGFQDAHRLAGTGRGTTWCDRGLFSYFPGLQIDHIYLGGALTAASCKPLPGHGSDHRALLAEIGLTTNSVE